MGRIDCSPEASPDGARPDANTGGWFGYAPLSDAGEPPDDAYSRVTNPERFRPLHGAALRLIEQLEVEYDVEVEEGYDLPLPRVSKCELELPPVRLTPNDRACAPITIAFTGFPGIVVKLGKWKEEPFPNCGCDACDEDAGEEVEGMTAIFESVTGGGFLEAIRIPRILGDGWVGSALKNMGEPMTEPEGAARLEWARMRGKLRNYRVFQGERLEKVLSGYERMSERRVERSKALEMSGGSLYLEYDWKPWPRRRHSQNGESDV